VFAQHHAAYSVHRLFVSDIPTGRQFLIDSGAEISVIPPGNNTPRPSDTILTAANDTRIKTYSPKQLQIDLSFKRFFTWTFEMADLSRPIIEADFLHYYGLLIDIRNNRLVDLADQKSVFSIAELKLLLLLNGYRRV
jgi:cleavage and polyadenylation specificity factor subunit 1